MSCGCFWDGRRHGWEQIEVGFYGGWGAGRVCVWWSLILLCSPERSEIMCWEWSPEVVEMWAWQEELTLLFGGGPAGDWSGVVKGLCARLRPWWKNKHAPLLGYSSTMACTFTLSTRTWLCNHHHQTAPELFSSCKNPLYPLNSPLPAPFHPWQPPSYFPSLWIWWLQVSHARRIIQSFVTGLFH